MYFCVDINDCENKKCSHHGSCWDLIADYECVCDFQWTGEDCESGDWSGTTCAESAYLVLLVTEDTMASLTLGQYLVNITFICNCAITYMY